MSRPKVHGERVEWKLRVPKNLADSIDKAAAELGLDRTAYVVMALGGPFTFSKTTPLTGPELITKGQQIIMGNQSPETPDSSTPKPVSGDKNCPHKYRVQRGQVSVCAACGDPR